MTRRILLSAAAFLVFCPLSGAMCGASIHFHSASDPVLSGAADGMGFSLVVALAAVLVVVWEGNDR